MTIFELNIFGLNISPTYYGLMYAISFLIGFYFLKKNLKTKDLDSLFIFIVLGVIIGGRLGYLLFYDLELLIYNPLIFFKTWEGGMSFHGGLIGVIISVFIYSRIFKDNFLNIIDNIALIAPVGIFLGRIGNYINGELLGFSNYNGIFAINHEGISYFPSTLLEAFLEGILLFIILSYFNNKFKISGLVSALFLIFYAIFRIFVEFFRLPDAHIGYLYGTDFITRGHVLSFIMLVFGIITLYFVLRKHGKTNIY